MCDARNHGLDCKLVGHSIVNRLNWDDNEHVSSQKYSRKFEMKKIGGVLNIKQVYNIRHKNNKAIKSQRSKLQQLLKLLNEHQYVLI